jgi:large subunit ribosomal protein L4
MAGLHQGTHKAKTRGEVRRTTAKWYRQKGTGRARHGARSAPLFVGGGVAHGPKPRSYDKRMPRKMRRAALRSALSALAADDQIVVVDRLEMDTPKTSAMKQTLRNLVGEDSALVLLAGRNEPVELSVRNLPNARYLHAAYLNIRDLLSHDRVVIPQDALEVIQVFLGKN